MRIARTILTLAATLSLAAPAHADVVVKITPVQLARPMLTLTSTHPGASWADITVRARVGVQPLQHRPAESDGWSAVGCGAISGFFIAPRGGDPVTGGTGAVDIDGITSGQTVRLPGGAQAGGGDVPKPPMPLGVTLTRQEFRPDETPPVWLAPGRYRAYLISDATGGKGFSCTVRVPLVVDPNSAPTPRPGHPDPFTITARTGNHTRLQWGMQPVSGAAGTTVNAYYAPAPRAGMQTFPVTVGRSTMALVWMHWTFYGLPTPAPVPSNANGYAACIEPGTTEINVASPAASFTCAKLEGQTLPTRSAGPDPSEYRRSLGGTPATVSPAVPLGYAYPSAVDIAEWYPVGRLAPGASLAKIRMDAVGTPTSMQAALFALDL